MPISGRSLVPYVRSMMKSRPRTRIPSRPRLGCDMNHLPRRSLLMLLKEKRIKTSAKGVIPAKKKQSATKSKGTGADEGTGVTPGVPDVPSYDFEAEQISWKSSDEEHDDEEYDEQDDDIQDDEDQEHDGQYDEEQDDVNEKTDSDNDGDE
ncbi:hypothetical protein Tco_1266673, partial [Tanacetum coccineum]